MPEPSLQEWFSRPDAELNGDPNWTGMHLRLLRALGRDLASLEVDLNEALARAVATFVCQPSHSSPRLRLHSSTPTRLKPRRSSR